MGDLQVAPQGEERFRVNSVHAGGCACRSAGYRPDRVSGRSRVGCIRSLQAWPATEGWSSCTVASGHVRRLHHFLLSGLPVAGGCSASHGVAAHGFSQVPAGPSGPRGAGCQDTSVGMPGVRRRSDLNEIANGSQSYRFRVWIQAPWSSDLPSDRGAPVRRRGGCGHPGEGVRAPCPRCGETGVTPILFGSSIDLRMGLAPGRVDFALLHPRERP